MMWGVLKKRAVILEKCRDKLQYFRFLSTFGDFQSSIMQLLHYTVSIFSVLKK